MAGSIEYSCNDIEQYVIAPDSDIVYPVNVEIGGNFAYVSGLSNLVGASEGKRDKSNNTDNAFLKCEKNSGAAIIIDFGKNISGKVEILFENSSGATLLMTSGESRELLNKEGELIVDENFEKRWSNVRERIQTSKGKQAWSNSNTFGAFRYLMLYFDNDGEVEISCIRVQFSAYRGTSEKFKGWFLCDDKKLNEFFYKAAYTLNLCTIKSEEGYVRGSNRKICDGEWVLVDGAKRDRLLWICDLNVSAASMYATFNETDIVKNALAEMVKSQLEHGNIPAASPVGFVKDSTYTFFEGAQWWIYVFEEYFRYTNDVEFVKKYYRSAVRMLEYAESLCDEDGLVRVDDKTNRGCMWSVPRYGWSTINNLLLANSYKNIAYIAKELKYDQDVKQLDEKYNKLINKINEKLFDVNAGAYIDSENNAINHPLAENALTVMFGIAPVDKRKHILDFITNTMWSPNGTTNVDVKYEKTRYDFPTHNKTVWPWLIYYEMMARLSEGDVERAFEVAKRTWGAMDATDANTAYWECFNAKDVTTVKGANNLSHGISTGIIPFLTNGVLGIIPLLPGFKKFKFSPNPGHLKYITGEIPTPSGNIKASIAIDEGIYDLIVPEGLVCCADLPSAAITLVKINGKVIGTAIYEKRIVLPEIMSGIYRIETFG